MSASASSLASGRTRNIGVLVPFLDRWFFSTVLSGVASALMRRGYDITLYNLTADREERRSVFETFLRRRRVDGVIAISIELGDAETERLLELDLPVIAIGGPNPGLTTLTVDDVGGRAARHRAPARPRPPRHRAHRREPRVRHRLPHPDPAAAGLRAGAVGCRDPRAPRAVRAGRLHHRGRLPRGRSSCSGDPATRPTAIFAASDEMAIGALLAARELGYRVPEDLSVIGIDGHELGEFFRLTTVDQFPLGQGERAAEAILAELEATGSRQEPAALPFELIVRGSTARRV